VTDIILPEGLISIPDGSFFQAKTFQTISIPSTCKEIGQGSFQECFGISSFIVDKNNLYFQSINGVLFNKSGDILVHYPCAKSGDYDIPSNVTTIQPNAFAQCTKIGTLNIPSSVVNMSFDGSQGPSIVTSANNIKVAVDNPKYCDIDGVLCNTEKTILYSYPARPSSPYIVPESITEIAPQAFYVSNVSSINLNNVEQIGAGAFQFATNILSVNIGPKIKYIGEAAFIGCNKLATISVSSNNQYYKAEDNILFSKDGTHLIFCLQSKTGNYTIPSTVINIDGRAFSQTRLNSIVISNSVKTIGTAAFSYCQASKINFEAGSVLDSIGESAFYKANQITSLSLPTTVRTIGGAAFSSMASLTSFDISPISQLESLGKGVFANNPSLTKIDLGGTTNMKEIPSMMASGDSKLQSFVIPSSVINISDNAFQNTPSMSEIIFSQPSSIISIGQNAFSKSGITNIDIPQTVNLINSQAFDNCSFLRKVNIPASVSSIGTGAFNMCESMVSFEVESSNASYAALDGMLCTKNKDTLVAFPAGKADTKYTLIPNFKTVAPYAFYGSKKISNITFPASITNIGERAIALCTNLKSMSFMGTENVPILSSDIMYESANTKDVTIFVRKAWYENSANEELINNYNIVFKDVHPSFISKIGYDRGTEFFPTSLTNVGVIGFYMPRTSVIISDKAQEDNNDILRGKQWKNTYIVNTILDNAYQSNQTVRDIVFLGDIGTIGVNAFRAGNQLKGIYFVGDIPALLNSTDYDMDRTDYPFNENQSIYVKESKVASYQDKWEVNNHTLNITYKIPQSTKYEGGTVCFPFDIRYPEDLDIADIKPYIPIDYSHVYDVNNPFVRAYSIDDYYVPAFVGALIRSKNSSTVLSYCQIDEEQLHDISTITKLGYSPDNYKMIGIVEDTLVVNEPEYNLYAFSSSQGKLLILNNGVVFPYFKAYLKMPIYQPNQVKAFSIFYDGAETTGISDTKILGKTVDDSYYNMSGMKVAHPTQGGLYIRKGKKLILK